MTLQEKLSAMKKDSIATLPPKQSSILLEETGNLIRSGIADKAIKAGETLPEFTLPDEKGNLVSSAALLAQGPLAITFYRGVWWPYCNVELAALQEVYGQIREMGGALISISPQLGKYTKQVVKKNGLTFPVLADKDNAYAKKLNLDFILPQRLKDVYKTFGIDLERFNGNDSWELPLAARFIIDQNGIIQNTEVNPDHTIRPEPGEIIDLIKPLI